MTLLCITFCRVHSVHAHHKALGAARIDRKITRQLCGSIDYLMTCASWTRYRPASVHMFMRYTLFHYDTARVKELDQYVYPIGVSVIDWEHLVNSRVLK